MFDDFYRFQLNKSAAEKFYGKDESVLTDKQLIKKRKMELAQKFVQD